MHHQRYSDAPVQREPALVRPEQRGVRPASPEQRAPAAVLPEQENPGALAELRFNETSDALVSGDQRVNEAATPVQRDPRPAHRSSESLPR